MSLITKYRPNSFEAVAGNTLTVKKIKAMLDKTDPKHTFLLTGPKGCGKTTIGRLIAKYVKCDMELDYIEYDATILNGVGPARELIDKCQYSSFTAGPRVWLIDECHRMRPDAQEILLKTFEEPPKHVYFILATTNPEKLKSTLIDRCAHFSVQPLDENEFVKFVKKIARRENLEVPENVIQMMYDKAEGRPRTSLNMLEKMSGMSPEEMLSSLETLDTTENEIKDLCRAMLKQESWKSVSEILRNVLDKEDAESIRLMVFGYMCAILSKGTNEKAFEIASNFKDPFYSNGKNDLIFSCYNAMN